MGTQREPTEAQTNPNEPTIYGDPTGTRFGGEMIYDARGSDLSAQSSFCVNNFTYIKVFVFWNCPWLVIKPSSANLFMFSKRRRYLEYVINAKRMWILSIVRSRQDYSWTDAFKLYSFVTSGVFVNASSRSYSNAIDQE
jgi:hypothetical protein